MSSDHVDLEETRILGPIDHHLRTSFRNFSIGASSAVMLLALAVCVGWSTGLQELMHLSIADAHGDFHTSTIPSAIAFSMILLSISMLLLGIESRTKLQARVRSVSALCAAAMCLIVTALKTTETLTKADWNLDHRWFSAPDGMFGFDYPGMMPPDMAASIALLCLSCLLWDVRTRKTWQPFQIAAVGAGALCLMPLIGFALDLPQKFCTFFGCVTMPAIGALFFIVLAASVLLFRADTGAMKAFVDPGKGGQIARFLVGALTLVPAMLALRKVAVMANLCDQSMGWIGFVVVLLAGGTVISSKVIAIFNAESREKDVIAQHNELMAMENRDLTEKLRLSESQIPRQRRRVAKTITRNICLTCSRYFEEGIDCCPDDGTSLTQIFEDSLVGANFAERYEILSHLGSGGVSAVYKAKHLLLDKMVAIKLMHPHLLNNAGSLKRFQQEAKASSNLNHKNLISIYDFGVFDGQPFLVMDFIEGCSLADLIERHGQLQIDRSIRIFGQICDGLVAAHDMTIVHRDLKPSNVMLINPDGEQETVKIVDFGMAKVLNEDSNQIQKLTQTGECFGSPLYMSPEQCLGRGIDHRTDIYAMGILMYECLSGKAPICGNTVLETFSKHLSEAPPPFERSLSVPPDLEQVILRCLEKDPVLRPQSFVEIKEALVQLAPAIFSTADLRTISGAQGDGYARVVVEIAERKQPVERTERKELVDSGERS